MFVFYLLMLVYSVGQCLDFIYWYCFLLWAKVCVLFTGTIFSIVQYLCFIYCYWFLLWVSNLVLFTGTGFLLWVIVHILLTGTGFLFGLEYFYVQMLYTNTSLQCSYYVYWYWFLLSISFSGT